VQRLLHLGKALRRLQRDLCALLSGPASYFPDRPPARIFVCIPEWTGPFDIEIDCIAMA
jgi:hypothetical protein